MRRWPAGTARRRRTRWERHRRRTLRGRCRRQFAVRPPQPSATWPQFLPSSAHLLGVQVPPSGPTIVPPPHTFG